MDHERQSQRLEPMSPARLYHHPRGQDLAGDFNVLMAALELAKVARGWIHGHSFKLQGPKQGLLILSP